MKAIFYCDVNRDVKSIKLKLNVVLWLMPLWEIME